MLPFSQPQTLGRSYQLQEGHAADFNGVQLGSSLVLAREWENTDCKALTQTEGSKKGPSHFGGRLASICLDFRHQHHGSAITSQAHTWVCRSFQGWLLVRFQCKTTQCLISITVFFILQKHGKCSKRMRYVLPQILKTSW